MKTSRRIRINRLVLVSVLATMVVALAPPASAATNTRVDFTVAESLPVSTPGTVIAGEVPECVNPSVATPTSSATSFGDATRFAGTKVISCDSGDTLELSFVAWVFGCSSFDIGRWRVEGGTGVFSGASGQGLLIGTYVGGDACSNSGIDDRYIGRLRLV